jgi:aminodeoxyfutalosine deaminase
VRKIAATYIVPGNQPPLKYGILICENDGTIIEVVDTGGKLYEQAGLEYYSGILVPGFINAHCHLELSHLKGIIPPQTGLAGFLGYVNQLRNAPIEFIEAAAKKADLEMKTSGIAAAGDISNSDTTLQIKRQSNICYHTFAETFGFMPSRAEKAFMLAERVQKLFMDAGLPSTVTAHSPYAVSETLFRMIADKALLEESLLSVHNQESMAELELLRQGTGPLADHYTNNLLLDISHWKPTVRNPMEYLLQFIPVKNQLLLVHNTYTSENDISMLKKHRESFNTFVIICPNSNLYIENRLPPVMLFRNETLNICIGTDSLASNDNLSVLQEMITLQQHFPQIKIEELIQWGCLNGAKALNIDDRFGSFEKGKKPGINLITGVDLQNLQLKRACRVKVLN